MTTETKTPESTPNQRREIHKLTRYDKEFKCEMVKQITGDPSKVSTMDLSIVQADKLIFTLTKNWAFYDKDNNKHMYILSLLRQMRWTVPHHIHGEVADLERFSNWLKSMKSPVKKPLKSMSPEETSRLITALESIVEWANKK